MNKKITILLASILAAIFSIVTISEAQTMTTGGLNARQSKVLGNRQAEQRINITRSGSLSTNQGSAEYFTGSVRIDTLAKEHEPSRTTVGRVTFEPGARTAWHTHPLGQTLIVTVGTAGFNSGVVRSRRSGREMLSGFRPA